MQNDCHQLSGELWDIEPDDDGASDQHGQEHTKGGGERVNPATGPERGPEAVHVRS